MSFNNQNILEALISVCHPLKGQDIVSLGMLQDGIRIEGNIVYLSIFFEQPNDFFAQSVLSAAERVIKRRFGNHIYIVGQIRFS